MGFFMESVTENQEGKFLFNDALNTFDLWLYGVGTYGKGPLR